MQKAPNETQHRHMASIMLWTFIATLAVLTTPGEAHAKRKDAKNSDTSNAPQKEKGSVKIKHQRSPSEESTAQRDRRLLRECNGLPNAGACRGYTRR